MVIGTTALGVGLAAASPGNDPTAGRAVFTGAATPHASSIVLNPAALGLGTLNEVYVAAVAVLDQIAINRRDLDPDTGAVYHALERVTLGITARTLAADQFVADRGALRYHTLGGGQRDYQLAAGFGFRASGRFHFGFSVTFDWTKLKLSYARDSALDGGHGGRGIDSDCLGTRCGIENPAAAERYDVDVEQASPIKGGYIVNLGFVVRVVKDLWLGVAYHTPPGGSVQSELTGAATITKALRDGGDVLHSDATVYVSYPASIDVEARSRIFGSRGADLELHVGGRWTDSSRLYAYDVRVYGRELLDKNLPEWTMRPRGLHDTFALWGGVEQFDAGERVRFGARVGVESAGVSPSKTSPMTIAPASLTVDVAAQLRISPRLVLQGGYGLQYFPTVDVTSSAYDPRDRIACVDGGYDYSTEACSAVRDGYAIPTAAGAYGRLTHALRVAVRYAW
ncbi:MAG: hypothetical protein NT062_00085 [Proteobacteria bacterium]|nr:hypothetical protein [Pseudomonadota bacterium]